MHIAKLALVQMLIFAVGLACAEIALRYILPLPVHGGTYHADGGKSVRIANDRFRLKPNLDVTHVASEFSAQIRTNELGYRKQVNESTAPDYLFLGDSFTFGHGVSDQDTFASIFCEENKHTCLNLGRSGTNTFSQLQVLKYAIDARGIRPKTVILVMLAACWINQSGNDLGDNLKHYRSKNNSSAPGIAAARFAGTAPLSSTSAKEAVSADQKSAASQLTNSLLKNIQSWLGEFEITKRTMLIVSSRLKSSLYACSAQESIDAAIASTRVALTELEQLATKHQFSVKVFSIHPYQELDGTFRKTQSNLRTAIPETFEYIATGQRFRKTHYFPYDGHFNVAGHANMAFVIERRLTEKRP